MSQLDDVFGPEGPLSQAAPHYRFREGQLKLANAIQSTIEQRGVLIAEAGTGVGKTFAYLAPLLQTQGKSLISTATRHLQDQLYQRDLPRVKAALGVAAEIAILKGRSNYLCLHRMEMHQDDGRFHRREDVHAFQEIVRFASVTHTGDISECAAVPENAAVWVQATSTRENCLGQDCPKLNDCFLMAARKRAAEADIVVVNHHLLCADMALRDEGFGELLPTVDDIVIDEAHSLPEIATQFFGQSISTQLLNHLARDALAVGLQHARDAASWPDLCAAVEKAASDLRLLMPSFSATASSADGLNPSRRISWDSLSLAAREQWQQTLDAATDALIAIHQVLAINAERHVEIAQLESFSQDLIARIGAFCDDDEGMLVVRWIETSRYSVTLHITPYDIREKFSQEMTKHQRSWILVSATLAIGGSFQHFADRLGLQEAPTLMAESPFDFQTQGLLLVPDSAPDPKSPSLISDLLSDPAIQELLAAVNGGIFLLCTSHRSVGHARDWVTRWAQQHPERLVLVQGDAPRHQLIDRFREHGRAVLIGSHSFWEGVDVPGRALSMVLIDKIPFAPPDDPILEARSRWLARQGRDAFSSIQLPEAGILLKQGVGRLIRSESDRGLVVIGDRRLAETAYGRKIIRSLPAFRRTRSVVEAIEWLKNL